MMSFLEEQLERVRQMTERVAEARSLLLETSELVARDRYAMHYGPLHEVRDLRTHQTHDPQPGDRSSAIEPAPRRRRRR
jgi:hypothetical protein